MNCARITGNTRACLRRCLVAALVACNTQAASKQASKQHTRYVRPPRAGRRIAQAYKGTGHTLHATRETTPAHQPTPAHEYNPTGREPAGSGSKIGSSPLATSPCPVIKGFLFANALRRISACAGALQHGVRVSANGMHHSDYKDCIAHVVQRHHTSHPTLWLGVDSRHAHNYLAVRPPTR